MPEQARARRARPAARTGPGSSRSGSGLRSSPSRLIQTIFRSELARRSDIVEEARRHVDVVRTLGGRQLEETLPVPVRRLVGADVLGRDDQVERYAERLFGLDDQCAIGVGEDREIPAAPRSSSSACGTSRNGGQSGNERDERARLALPGSTGPSPTRAARASASAPPRSCDTSRPGPRAPGGDSERAGPACARRRRGARARRAMPAFQSISVP